MLCGTQRETHSSSEVFQMFQTIDIQLFKHLWNVVLAMTVFSLHYIVFVVLVIIIIAVCSSSYTYIIVD